MLNLLLAGPRTSLAEGNLLDTVATALRAAGHEVQEAAPRPDLGALDGVLVVADGYVPEACAAALGQARGAGKLALLVHTAPSALEPLATHHQVAERLSDIAAAAVALARTASPHAGKIVRDQVPRLVREAGHDLRFREAAPEERPLLLKRKVAELAAGLERAQGAEEREEATDLLEALETLIRARAWSRDDLRLLKQAKLKRRGGYERCFVVEGGAAAADTTRPAAAPAAPPPAPAATLQPALPAEPIAPYAVLAPEAPATAEADAEAEAQAFGWLPVDEPADATAPAAPAFPDLLPPAFREGGAARPAARAPMTGDEQESLLREV